MPDLRLLVVDDSAIYRQTIVNSLRDVDGVDVVGVAKNGIEAIEKMTQLDPDIVTLDYEMPGADGITVLREMKERRVRAKAIMVSSYTAEGAQVTTDALLEGAFDFVLKPVGGSPEENRRTLRNELLQRFSTLVESLGRIEAAFDSRADPLDGALEKSCDLVVIGASTGGPVALRKILAELPGDFALPIVVVQHMPQAFTKPLARRLDQVCSLDVVETAHRQRIRAGAVYVAAGGQHTRLQRRDQRVYASLTDDPPENNCRPAVDYTLRHAAEVFAGRVCAVILTGMGHDGLVGCRNLKEQGGFVLAQHPDDCSVYGMPKSVIEAGLADRVLRTSDIARALGALA